MALEKIGIDEMKRFIFKKPFTTESGNVIPENTTIDIVRHTIYVNHGLCDRNSASLLYDIMTNPELCNEYLKEVYIIPNQL